MKKMFFMSLFMVALNAMNAYSSVVDIKPIIGVDRNSKYVGAIAEHKYAKLTVNSNRAIQLSSNTGSLDVFAELTDKRHHGIGVQYTLDLSKGLALTSGVSIDVKYFDSGEVNHRCFAQFEMSL